MILEHLTEQARRAHNWTSFDPEKRGDQLIKDYSEELEEDLATIPDEYQSRFKENYERHLTKWLHSKSRCMSSMITGPAKFPVARAQKYNNWEQGSYETFRSWREKALKAIKRDVKKLYGVTPAEEMRNKLQKAQELQEYMKKINKLHAAYEKSKSLEALEGLTEKEVSIIVNYVPGYSWEKHPFPPFALTNNSANIRRMEERLAELESKEEKAASEGPEGILFAGGVVILNYEMDRVQIQFPGKPDPETIQKLKSNAFKWAPSQTAWQRQLTEMGKRAARMVVKEISGEEIIIPE